MSLRSSSLSFVWYLRDASFVGEVEGRRTPRRTPMPISRGASDASSAWETVEPTPKPRRTAREASATKRVPRTVDEEDSWEASPQHPGDRHRRRRSVSQAVTQARWASPASDLTDSPSAARSGTHMNE